MAYLLYGNSGGIDLVKKSIERKENVYDSLLDALKYAADTPLCSFGINDLSVKYYGYDPRINKEVYVILTNRCGKENYIKKYGTPQFVFFMVEV